MLRNDLKRSLPEYMVPSAFVVLPELPLNSSGKLDRRALPAPDLSAFSLRPYEPPRGAAEETLARIWQELLKLERVGRCDNFFQLGGHSLLIVQMLEQLRRAGFSAPVRALFERPTVDALAEALTPEDIGQGAVPPNQIPDNAQSITPAMLPLIALEQEHVARLTQLIPGGAPNIQDIYPLAPLQEGILFHHLLTKVGDTYVLPTLLAVASRHRLDELIAALQGVIDRHDVLRTAIVWEGMPRPLQVVCRQARLGLEEFVLDPSRDAVAQVRERLSPIG